jgi:hypothetical protein
MRLREWEPVQVRSRDLNPGRPEIQSASVNQLDLGVRWREVWARWKCWQNCEGGGGTFLWNAGKHLQGYAWSGPEEHGHTNFKSVTHCWLPRPLVSLVFCYKSNRLLRPPCLCTPICICLKQTVDFRAWRKTGTRHLDSFFFLIKTNFLKNRSKKKRAGKWDWYRPAFI